MARVCFTAAKLAAVVGEGRKRGEPEIASSSLKHVADVCRQLTVARISHDCQRRENFGIFSYLIFHKKQEVHFLRISIK